MTKFNTKNRKIEDVRVPDRKHQKSDVTSLKQHFPNLRKLSYPFLLRLCGPSFNKISLKLWKLKARTYAHTHRRIDRDRPGTTI